MRDRLTVVAYLGGWRLVRILPEPVAYALFALIADIAWWRDGKGVARLRANLARAVPEADEAQLRRLTRAGMRSYLRYWCDAFRLPSWSHERTVGTVRIEGAGLADARAALDDGRGLVLALAHQGNWDHVGAWSTTDWAEVTTVAERLRPAAVYERFLRFREDLGMRILTFGDPGVLEDLAVTLKGGGFVPLLSDRDLSSRGVPVTLLGERARVAAGPSLLALDTGAALHPLSIWYERLPKGAPARWGAVAHFHAAVTVPAGERGEQVAAMAQQIADGLGAGIRAHPEDWHMLQKVFEADLEPRQARS